MESNAYHHLLFGVRRSIRYHSRRRAFYEIVDRWTNFLLLLLGSGTVMLALFDSQDGMLAVGLGVTIVSSLRLVFAFGLKGNRHAQFVKDFTLLEKRLHDTSEEAVIAITQERLDLETLEPPVLRVLDVLCHNELLRAMGNDDPNEQVPVSWFQRQMAQFFDYKEQDLVKGG